LIVRSEDCAAPPPHVPDPPSTPTVCTVPPSVAPPSSPEVLDPLEFAELDVALELAPRLDVEPFELPEPDEAGVVAEVPELNPPEVDACAVDPPLDVDPLAKVDAAELDPLMDPETGATPVDEVPVAALLPHAPTTTARQARPPVSVRWGRTLSALF
jgi:hypothetical protein